MIMTIFWVCRYVHFFYELGNDVIGAYQVYFYTTRRTLVANLKVIYLQKVTHCC